MPTLTASFGVRLQGLKSLRDGRRQSSELQVAAKRINQDIHGFILKRYDIFSKGGGDWPPIKPATARRKGNSRILYHTGDLRAGLKLGLYQRVTWNGPWMIITFQMKARRRHKPSGLPIQELVAIHQRGLGRNPKRPIIVGPDAATKRKALNRLATAVRKRQR